MNNNYFYKLASIADRLSGMRKEAVNWSNYINPILAGVNGLIDPTSLLPTMGGVIGLPGWSGIGKDSQESEVINNPEPITIPSGPISMDPTAFQNAFNASSVSQYPEDPIYTQTSPSPAWTDLQAGMRTNSGQIPTQPEAVSTVVPEQSVAPQQALQSPIKSKQQQLVDRWIAEKENRFRKKNPNYRVDPRAIKMMERAADMIVQQEGSQFNPMDPKYTDSYAFNVLNSGSIQDRIARNAPAKYKQSVASNTKQNPTAGAAIQNPMQYTQTFDDAQRWLQDWTQANGDPWRDEATQRQVSAEFSKQFPHLYSVPPGSTALLEHGKAVKDKGLPSLGWMGMNSSPNTSSINTAASTSTPSSTTTTTLNSK